MASTYLSLHYHIVFSTKERRPLIRDDWREGMHKYLGGIIKGLAAVPEAVGGVDDHVHLLVGMRATHCLADFMRELKKASSIWAATHHEKLFEWQEGYAAFTVSATHLRPVRDYIANQVTHHEKTDFINELKQLLKKNEVKYDPKYLL